MRTILGIIFFVTLTGAYGQQLFFEQYPASLYKGATQNWEADQDEEGVLYFANNDGVLIFDGREWNMLPMPNKDFVFSLALDSKRNIFVSSFNEFGVFERKADKTYDYRSLLSLVPEEFREFKEMDQVMVYRDTVFYVHRERIFVFHGDTITVLPEKNARLLKLRAGMYLFRRDGMSVYDNRSFVALSSAEISGMTMRWAGVFDERAFLMLDDRNRLWKLTPEAPEGEKLVLLSADMDRYLKQVTRFRMIALDNGMIAIVSKDEILFLDHDIKPVYSIPKESTGENFTTRMVFEDREHNLWVTTNASILQVTTSSPLSFYDKHNGLDGVILCLGKSRSDEYVGTTSGVYHREGRDRFSLIPECAGETWNFYSFNEKLFVAHSRGVFSIDGKKASKLVDHRYVHSLCALKDSPDKLIMGTYNSGLWLLSMKNGKWAKSKIHGFGEEVRFVLEDKNGDIWVSHYNKGVYQLRLNPAMDSVSTVRFYDSNNGLPSNLNNRLYGTWDNGVVVTTIKGLYEYDVTRDTFVPHRETPSDAICIYTLDKSENGDYYFWGGYPNREHAGVLRKKEGRYEPFFTPFRKTLVPVRDQRVDVDAPVLCVGEDEVWIANNLRLVRYNPLQKTFFHDPFEVFIRRVYAGDSAIYNVTNRLPFRLNSIHVQFVSTFIESAERTEYQYKLEGFQKGWSNWTSNNEAVFTNLPHGNYTFSVRARNLYGNVSAPVSWTFNIDPPWYKTWWALLGFMVIALVVVGLMVEINIRRIKQSKIKLEKKVRRKTKKLRARNREVLEKGKEIAKQAKELEALNLTKDKLFSIVSHDLRGPVKQIQVVMNMMELNHITEEEFRAYFPKLKESIEHTVNLTDNLLHWANSQKDGIRVKPSVFNLRDIAEENYQLFKPLADGKRIAFINKVDTDLHAFADKDMIKLVLRNLVNNAIKFTDEGKDIALGAGRANGFIEVFVQDTGIGLDEDKVKSLFNKNNLARKGTFGEKGVGLGLLLCREFITKNGGSIHVSSEPGKGSKFTFTIPAHDDGED